MWHTTENTEMRKHPKPYEGRGKVRTKETNTTLALSWKQKEGIDIH